MTIPPIPTKGLIAPLTDETQRVSYSAIAEQMNTQIKELQTDNKIQALEIAALKSALDSSEKACEMMAEEIGILRSRLTLITSGVRRVIDSMNTLTDDSNQANSILGLGDK